MSADLSRNSFDEGRRFLRVLLQQGRPLLDADYNEQVAILLHHHWTFVRDLVGDRWGPSDRPAIGLKTEGTKISITDGTYYVNGILCENEKTQLIEMKEEKPTKRTLYYLDVWERHLTAFEASEETPFPDVIDPLVQDPAWGHIESTTRTKVEWQVRSIAESEQGKFDNIIDKKKNSSDGEMYTAFNDLLVEVERVAGKNEQGKLSACARHYVKKEGQPAAKPCPDEPEPKYRGPENQLYRVEIHEGGRRGKASFKWSRDNGSLVYPIIHLSPLVDSSLTVRIANLGRDLSHDLQRGCWVELVDDRIELHRRDTSNVLLPLLRVISVSDTDNSITLKVPAGTKIDTEIKRHPLLRRWDQSTFGSGGLSRLKAINMENKDQWIELEDGVYVQFTDGLYFSGDAWLIPARSSTGDVMWPLDENRKPKPVGPHEPKHYFAPLGIVYPDKDGKLQPPIDLRNIAKKPM